MTNTTPTDVALAGYGLFLGLAFGLRTAVHWWRTGRSGFVLPASDAPMVERLGSGLFVLAVLGGALAPLLQRAGWLSPIARLDGWVGHALGTGGLLAGVVGTVWAQFAMGESWRVGVDPTARTSLVAQGPFRWVRNPIFTNMLVATAGLVLLVPNVLAVVTFLVLLVGLEVQVRQVEEPYLRKTHGASYRAYAPATGRFLPGIGRGVGEVG
jgi:protein-S-isoprenylcysteine O-methyltransferase Ste14